MTKNPFTFVARIEPVQAVAWVALGLCICIIVLASVIASVTATRQMAALDPLPVLRWDDISNGGRR